MVRRCLNEFAPPRQLRRWAVFREVALERDEKLTKLMRDMLKHFVIPPSNDQSLNDFDAASNGVRHSYQQVLTAFRHSLSATVSTVTMPFALAYASTEQWHFGRLHIAERIRAQMITEDGVPEGETIETYREREAHVKAQSSMQDFSKSEDGLNILIGDTCTFLMNGLHHGLEAATKELLQQGLVLLWSAFEVLFRDSFETLLNEAPGNIQTLISHPKTRKRFEAERLPLDTLVQHGFDLSSRLGSVLIAQQDFSDLRTIKAVYSVLFPEGAVLNDALDHRDLWMLFQRRHLIVHRRGVIDQAYLQATGENGAIGTQLTVTPDDFEKALSVVIAAGTALAHTLPMQEPAQQIVGRERRGACFST
jgi:hypothetical protein